ncbi:MAG: hypothetical protein IT449_01730 [Phycisphaerales bacterium]|nr:hypothetical protein [Phycisphaerales bacterium]
MPKAKQKNVHHKITESSDGDKPYLLHPEDDNLFVRTGRQIIQACRLGISVEVWLDELKSVTEFVRVWAADSAGRVRSCYCAPRGSVLLLFFCPSSPTFDFELADRLAELNLELNQKFNLGAVEVHQVPLGELDRFVDTESALLVYGEHFKSPAAVEA